jgi:hypothetical protein
MVHRNDAVDVCFFVAVEHIDISDIGNAADVGLDGDAGNGGDDTDGIPLLDA